MTEPAEKPFKVRLRHDTGAITLTICASSPHAAKSKVIEAEKCPETAIRWVIPAALPAKRKTA